MVWVEPAAWATLIAEHDVWDADALLLNWAGNGWPLVARSRICEDRDDLLALGVPLPPSHGKSRHAFRCGGDIVIHSERPPLLSFASAAAPSAWLATISALLMLDSETRCFGSLAWEYLTGLPYISTGSDLDILWVAASAAEADRLAMEISRIDAAAPVHVDGEFVLPSGNGVQWREWASQAPSVLLKTPDGPRIVPRDRVFA